MKERKLKYVKRLEYNGKRKLSRKKIIKKSG
jgi:hypothetical protein